VAMVVVWKALFDTTLNYDGGMATPPRDDRLSVSVSVAI